MTLLEEIHTRGYWSVVVRPQDFRPDRVAKLSEVKAAVRDSAVELRGWDFPHIDHRDFGTEGEDWVQQECAWEHYRELWRAYKSGLFSQQSGLRVDWRDHSSLWPRGPGWGHGQHLSVEDTVFHLSEIFEFAARFSRTACGGEFMAVDIGIHNLQGRTLQLSERKFGFLETRRSRVSEWTYKKRVAREFLQAEGSKLAIEPAIEIFERFGWDVKEQVIREVQEELRR